MTEQSIFTPGGIAAARKETERLSRELDIANADHVALWLEANLGDASLGWLAVRIVEAHEAAKAEPVVDGAAEVRRALALCLTLAEPTPFTSDTARAVFLAGVQGEARRIVRGLPDHVGRVETGKGESDRG